MELTAVLVNHSRVSMADTARRSDARRILLVDDYVEVRDAVREALEERGYAVVEAAHGQQALHYLVSHAPGAVDLIVLDLVMPVMDGWQFLRVASNYVGLMRIPVVIVSGHPPRLNQTNHRGVIGVLHAPYEMRELIALVAAGLSPDPSSGPPTAPRARSAR